MPTNSKRRLWTSSTSESRAETSSSTLMQTFLLHLLSPSSQTKSLILLDAFLSPREIQSPDYTILQPYHIGPLRNKPQLLMLIMLQAACLGKMCPISINDCYLCPPRGDWSSWNKRFFLSHYLNCSLPSLCFLSPLSHSQTHFPSLCSFLCPLFSPSPGLVPCLGSISFPLTRTPLSPSSTCSVLKSSCVPKGVQ